jgi:capsular exopolysaccharide synthesis family protein
MHGRHGELAPGSADEFGPRRESIIESAMNKRVRTKEPGGRTAATLDVSEDTLAPVHSRAEPPPYADSSLELQEYDGALSVAIFRPLLGLAKHYEGLRTALWLRDLNHALKVVVFVAPAPFSGVSTTASNYAAMIAQEVGVKVLLIDANLRESARHTPDRPEADRHENGVTLAGLLTKTRCPVFPLPGATNLYVLPSGADCGLPLGLFQSTAFDEFLQTVRERFQYIVVDAPPIQGHPETLMLSRKADGVVLVVESERTRKRTALWAKQQIEEAGGRLLGVVLNKRKRHIPDWLYKRVFA